MFNLIRGTICLVVGGVFSLYALLHMGVVDGDNYKFTKTKPTFKVKSPHIDSGESFTERVVRRNKERT